MTDYIISLYIIVVVCKRIIKSICFKQTTPLTCSRKEKVCGRVNDHTCVAT